MPIQTAQSIGKAVIVYGTVKAVSPAGVERLLTPNSPIYANERIVTGTDGSVSLWLAEQNTHLDLGRMSEVVLDEDVYAADQGRYVVADAATDIADIQAALEGGNFDPTTGLPAPAAGGGVVATGPRGGGRALVIFTPDQMEVIPDSGAETTGIGRNFLDPPPVEYLPEDEPIAPAPIIGASAPPAEPPVVPPLVDTEPSIGTIEFTLSEANLADGSSPNAAALTMRGTLADLKVDFGPDTPGTLDFGNGNTIVIDGVGGDSLTIAGTYGTLIINDDGTWSYTLTDNTIDHSVPGATGVNDQVQESFTFSAIDSDGSVTTGGNITVYILDDGPTITGTDVQGAGAVQEDALGLVGHGNPDSDNSVGNLDSPGDTDTVTIDLSQLYSIQPGADGLSSMVYNVAGLSSTVGVDSGLTSNGVAILYFQDGNSIVGKAGTINVFTLNLDSTTQTAVFNLNDQLDHNVNDPLQAGDDGVLTINNLGQYIQVIVTDGDGDSASLNLAGRLTITVENDVPIDAPPFEGGIGATVEEDGMSHVTVSGGIDNDGNPDAKNLSILFIIGADEPLTFGLSEDTSALATLYSQGKELQYDVNNNILTASTDAGSVFTLTVNADGSWKFDLQKELDHVDDGTKSENMQLISNNKEGHVNGIDFSSILTATDADGDTETGAISGMFTITVLDDVPVTAPSSAVGIGTMNLEDGMSYVAGDSFEGNKDVSDLDHTLADDGGSIAGSVRLPTSLSIVVDNGIVDTGSGQIGATGQGSSDGAVITALGINAADGTDGTGLAATDSGEGIVSANEGAGDSPDSSAKTGGLHVEITASGNQVIPNADSGGDATSVNGASEESSTGGERDLPDAGVGTLAENLEQTGSQELYANDEGADNIQDASVLDTGAPADSMQSMNELVPDPGSDPAV